MGVVEGVSVSRTSNGDYICHFDPGLSDGRVGPSRLHGDTPPLPNVELRSSRIPPSPTRKRTNRLIWMFSPVFALACATSWTDGHLVVADERLIEQHELRVEAPELALDDLVDHVGRLASFSICAR